MLQSLTDLKNWNICACSRGTNERCFTLVLCGKILHSGVRFYSGFKIHASVKKDYTCKFEDLVASRHLLTQS